MKYTYVYLRWILLFNTGMNPRHCSVTEDLRSDQGQSNIREHSFVLGFVNLPAADRNQTDC